MIKTLFLTLLLILTSNISGYAQENYQVGVILGQTGPAAKYGKFARLGLELALEEINAQGGVNGQKLELVIEDSQTQANHALGAFNKLSKNNGVKVVIGDVWEFLTNAFIPLADRDKILVISPTCMPHSITLTSPYFMTLGHQINFLDSAFRLYFKKNPEVKKLGLINWENDWGLGYSEKIKAISKEFGVEIVAEVNTLDWNGDFKAETTRVMQKKPDAIFAPYLAERVARRLREMKSETKLLTTLNIVEVLLDPESNKDLLEGIYYVDFSAPIAYQKKFRDRYHEEPQFESHLSYETLHSIAKGLQNNPQDLLAGIKTVKYQGVAGEINFQDSNFANQAKAVLYQIQNKQSSLVRE